MVLSVTLDERKSNLSCDACSTVNFSQTYLTSEIQHNLNRKVFKEKILVVFAQLRDSSCVLYLQGFRILWFILLYRSIWSVNYQMLYLIVIKSM